MQRKILVSLVVLFLVAAVVWAATEVTVTKSSSKTANAYYFVVGDIYVGAFLSETNDGYYLNYYVYDYSTYTYVERGAGAIDASDVTWSSGSVKLDTNTEDIAIVGDGGDIELEWDAAPDGGTESSSKSTYETDYMKRIYFSDIDSESAVVEGTFLGEDFSGTGFLRTTKGKVIMQVKD